MLKPKNPKERGLIKGALRRVFSRSDVRRSVLAAAVISGYHDPKRKRVTKWAKCQECGNLEAAYQMQVDHIVPVIGVTETLEDLTWDTLISRLWCEPSNLRVVCKPCHKLKTKNENAERRKFKKEGRK